MKKKWISILASVLAPLWVQAQDMGAGVLLEVGPTKVSVEEFERIYNKNNGVQSLDPKTPEEYLELFINFKLKVTEALALGMDTAETFRVELANYRRQLAQPYLADKSVVDSLIVESYQRMTEEVRARHILVEFPRNAGPQDTLRAYQKAQEVLLKLRQGADFAQMAKTYSADTYSAAQGGDLGYFSAFRMVYPFESACYNAGLNQVVGPVRSSFGYHIIQVTDRRPARGEIRVAHIMTLAPANADATQREEAKKKIDAAYQRLRDGADFAELAKELSEDQGSAPAGGSLPWFGTGRMVKPFEEAAYQLAQTGQFSQPIQTDYGWHIIQLLETRDVPSFEQAKGEIAHKIAIDPRANQSREVVVRRLMAEYDFQKTGSLAKVYAVIDTSIFAGGWDPQRGKDLQGELFRFAGKSYSYQDFLVHLNNKNNRTQPKTAIENLVDEAFERFSEEMVVAYEESVLDQKYPEYRYLVQEYHDGILLFELMDQVVWSKAVEDEEGLRAFHARNAANYRWPERRQAALYGHTDGVDLELAQTWIAKGEARGWDLARISAKLKLAQGDSIFLVERGAYLPQQNARVKLALETLGADAKNQCADLPDENIIVFVGQKLPPTNKSFDEARGAAIADYQNELEAAWVESLRAKYPVKVNRELLGTIKQP